MARTPRAEAVGRRFSIRLSPNEYDIVQTAARVNRQTASSFARDAIASAAGDCLEASAPVIVRLKSNRPT